MSKKLWRTMALYKAQFISMIIMIAIGIGIFLGFNMEWYTLDQNTGSFQKETHLADFRLISEKGFTGEDTEKIRGIDGVDDCGRFLSITTEVREVDGSTMALTVTENQHVSDFLVTDGQAYDETSPDGIWLSDKYADTHQLKIGDSLTFLYNSIRITGRISGLIKSGEYTICLSGKEQILPDFTSHGFAYISPVMMENALGQAYYPQIHVLTDLDRKTFTKEADRVLGETIMTVSKDEIASYAGPQGEIDEGKSMGTILPALFLLIAVLTMVTTMNRLTAKEKIQIGTCKALGFRNRTILRHYMSYSLIVGLIGTGIGCGLGYLVAYFILNPNGDMMACYIDMPDWHIRIPPFCYAVLVLLLLGLLFIGYLSTRQMLKGTAADALRPYTPRKVKPLLIERTKLFHRLSFGTRWNLRDTARHKARTLMSLIGTLGCMLIMLSCFGMFDTLDLFIDRYYGGALNYESRIYVTDEKDLAERYQGDTSGSVSVKIDDVAVSLDIYRIRHDRIRFLDSRMNYLSLGDDGAYICKRIARDHHLKAGDTVTVKPFGSDETYELTVAGVISSYAESISMTEAYAEKVGIPFRMDSVYTDTEKSDIEMTPQISTIQTKKSIVDAFNVMMNTMNVMIYALVSAAVILGTVVLYNLGVMSYTERYRELATLKVIGFRDSRLSRLLISQNLTVSIIGTVLAIPIAHVVLQILLDTLAPEYELTRRIAPLSYVISILLTLGVTLLVSVVLARKNRKIDMVESLKHAD